MAEEKLDVIKFLHEERKQKEKLLNMHIFNYLIFLGILLIDAISILALKITNLQAIAWIGVFSLIVLIGIEVVQIKRYKSECENIDYFYLTNEVKRKK